MDAYTSYTFRKDKKKKIIRIIIIIYILLIMIKALSGLFIGEIIQVNAQYTEHFFKETTQQKNNIFSKKHPQKILMLKTFLKYRVSKEGFSIKNKALTYDDMVWVSLAYPKYKNSFWKKIKNILYIMSMGIIKKNNSSYVVRKVAAVPGDVVVYTNKKIISVNAPIVKYIYDDENDIPFFDQRKKIILKKDEYFLIGRSDYDIDDTLLGATILSHIKGKAILLLGQRWGNITAFLR